jgi:hypothetical protein
VKEPHGKGRVSHPGPESCGEAREDLAEALTEGSAGERSSREITTSAVPTPLGGGRSQHRRGRYHECRRAWAQSEKLGMHGHFMHRNWGIPRPCGRG